MKQQRLGTSLAGEIIRPSLDLAQDYAEMSIDSLTVNPIIREIPVVKTAVVVFRTGLAIRERHFVHKLLTFLKEFHAGSTENEKNREFRERIKSDPAYRDRVVSHLLVIIDRYVTAEKAQILGNLFRAHADGDIDWEDFVSLSIVLDVLQPSSYKFLSQMAAYKPHAFTYHGGDRAEEAPLFAAGIATRHGTKFSVTRQGKMLYQFGIKPTLEPGSDAAH
jgi:hypothetical protein